LELAGLQARRSSVRPVPASSKAFRPAAFQWAPSEAASDRRCAVPDRVAGPDADVLRPADGRVRARQAAWLSNEALRQAASRREPA
jgi:hypothetical protein